MASDHDAGPPVSSAGAGDHEAPAAWRLTFEYHDDDVQLVARQKVAMLAPPDDSGLLARGRAGYWVEVRDAEGRALYRQVLSEPIRTEYEVFSPEPGQSPTRVAAPEVKGVFQTVVPDIPGASDVAVYGQVEPGDSNQPARTLVQARLVGGPPDNDTGPPDKNGKDGKGGKGKGKDG